MDIPIGKAKSIQLAFERGADEYFDRRRVNVLDLIGGKEKELDAVLAFQSGVIAAGLKSKIIEAEEQDKKYISIGNSYIWETWLTNEQC